MNILINRERLARTFIDLCEISSPSRREKAVSSHLRECFSQLGADSIIEDSSTAGTGSECGNLIIRFNGTRPDIAGVFFSSHMDTVEPGDGVKVARNGDIFTSSGETILGGDDKSGLAAMIEMMTIIRENKLEHGLIEFVLTTCEEVGLLGAKHLDYSLVKAPYGYALDSSGINTVITGAPAANKFKIEITGAAAHAGLNPEQGISAIQVAAKAINEVRLGRLDEQSTANFGLIKGGVATNIIPEKVIIEGEVRSHSTEKLAQYTAEIENIFRATVETWCNPSPENTLLPKVDIKTMAEYPAMSLSMDSAVIDRIRRAGEKSDKTLTFLVAGGGSDANIFNGCGLPTAIVATGMSKVHTTDEQLDLNDLVSLTELISSVVLCS
jgi:tripeptide aminopeptidase